MLQHVRLYVKEIQQVLDVLGREQVYSCISLGVLEGPPNLSLPGLITSVLKACHTRLAKNDAFLAAIKIPDPLNQHSGFVLTRDKDTNGITEIQYARLSDCHVIWRKPTSDTSCGVKPEEESRIARLT